MELLLLGIFAIVLLTCVFTGVSIIYAMLFGLVMFFSYGLMKKKTWKQMFIFSWEGAKTAKNVLVTFLLIGMMTATWRASGSIAFIVYYASGICEASIMLLAAFLLCSLVSFLTGTAFGTAATMGVICMTMAKSMNLSEILAGGAVLAGSYFGDRCSPVSTSALLVSELTKTNLYGNLKGMAKTAMVPFAVSCAVYWILGVQAHAGKVEGNIRAVLSGFYHLHIWTLVPVVIVLVCALFRIEVKRTLALSALAAIFVAVLIQKYPVSQLPSLCMLGFSPDNQLINKLMSGGGILSNLKVVAIVGISSCYSGIFKGTDFLYKMKEFIEKLNRKITPFGTTLLISTVIASVSCNQTLSIMLTSQLCGENTLDKKEFALSLENSAVIVPALIPWSIASAVPLAFIGAPTQSVCGNLFVSDSDVVFLQICFMPFLRLYFLHKIDIIKMILNGKGKRIMMYNPQLETFLCVVEAGSFSKAAEKLYISAPAVIKQINSLEKSLDLKLFERSYRGLKVTPAGEAIYQDTKYIINYCKESVERAKEAMDKKEEVIRVGISPLTPPQVFVELWPKIQKYDKEMKFQLITFENTPENAREILANLGQNIDVIAGVFDETMLKLRQCQGIEISKEQFCVAVSMHHKLANKDHLEIEDLYGENLMVIKEGWGKYADILREDLSKHHPQIYLKDFDFYSVDVFNQCENSDDMLLAFKAWESVHPLMKIIPVNWDYGMPFGLLYSRHPEPKVEKLLKAVKQIRKEDL